MAILLGLDPGPEQSALVLLTWGPTGDWQVRRRATEPNPALLTRLAGYAEDGGTLVVERVRSYGRPVGAAVFETVFWSGRFCQCWGERGLPWDRMAFSEVALHFCATARVKESAIRQVLLDRFGGERRLSHGTKRQPGPLYGVTGHAWSALAVAVAWADQRGGSYGSPGRPAGRPNRPG